MSTVKSSITIPSYPQVEIIQPLMQSSLPCVRKQDCQDVVITRIRSVVLMISVLAALPVLVKAQSLADMPDSSGAVASTPAALTRPALRASDRMT